MEHRLRLSSAAEGDLRQARRWYQEHAPHVDQHFRRSVGAALGRIEHNPHLYATVHQDIRRAPVRRFPYSILYRDLDPTILVIAILHQARDPEIWRSRGEAPGFGDR
jgi:plasmid stabilization system protein ParE